MMSISHNYTKIVILLALMAYAGFGGATVSKDKSTLLELDIPRETTERYNWMFSICTSKSDMIALRIQEHKVSGFSKASLLKAVDSTELTPDERHNYLRAIDYIYSSKTSLKETMNSMFYDCMGQLLKQYS